MPQTSPISFVCAYDTALLCKSWNIMCTLANCQVVCPYVRSMDRIIRKKKRVGVVCMILCLFNGARIISVDRRDDHIRTALDKTSASCSRACDLFDTGQVGR
ncbi:hypothetical protein L209DRAFT_313935 [Thermothelomyces heterothallicus CBS 203.75]